MATSASGIVWHNALPTLDMDRRVPMFVVKSMLEPKGWHIGDRINFAPEVPGLEGDVVMVCDGHIRSSQGQFTNREERSVRTGAPLLLSVSVQSGSRQLAWSGRQDQRAVRLARRWSGSACRPR